jgi:Myb-like DNA-binding domain
MYGGGGPYRGPPPPPPSSYPYGPPLTRSGGGGGGDMSKIDLLTGEARRKSGPKPWSKEEDTLLVNLVHTMQWPMKWTVVAQSLPGRTGKQCRERYVNHLNPRLKVADWSPVEDATIFHLYNTIGSHWAKMSKVIPGRTDNGIKVRGFL